MDLLDFSDCKLYFEDALPAEAERLIDFLDLRFKGRPLGRMLVRRNFRHLQRYLERRKVQGFPWSELMRHYEAASSASS